MKPQSFLDADKIFTAAYHSAQYVLRHAFTAWKTVLGTTALKTSNRTSRHMKRINDKGVQEENEEVKEAQEEKDHEDEGKTNEKNDEKNELKSPPPARRTYSRTTLTSPPSDNVLFNAYQAGTVVLLSFLLVSNFGEVFLFVFPRVCWFASVCKAANVSVDQE